MFTFQIVIYLQVQTKVIPGSICSSGCKVAVPILFDDPTEYDLGCVILM